MSRFFDLTGQRFGSLLAIEITSVDQKGRRSYRVVCDCGTTREITGSALKELQSCGHACPFRPINNPRKKPDLIPGQRFGRLTVIRQIGKVETSSGRAERHYICQCDCGQQIQVYGWSVQAGKTKSCGCLRKAHSGRSVVDLTGQKFGELVVKGRAGGGGYDADGKRMRVTWACLCSCGNTVNFSGIKLMSSRNHRKRQSHLNCRDHSKHLDGVGVWYPPTPSPYPQEAAELLKKYLKWTEPPAWMPGPEKSNLRDEKFDRLLRVAWTITYRISQGEDISELHQGRIILKHLRYANRAIAAGASMIDRRQLKSIGGRTTMANNQKPLTTLAVIEALPDLLLPKKPKKFKRR
jgi:hypothetical protein